MTRQNGPTRQQIIEEAMSWCDTPYQHQASSKGHGADCLGLIRGVYRTLYGDEPVSVPPYAPDWAESGNADLLENAAARYLVPRNDDRLIPGDIALFRIHAGGPARHLGLLTQENRFLHAYAGRRVCESWLGRWWAARLAGLYSFPGVQS